MNGMAHRSIWDKKEVSWRKSPKWKGNKEGGIGKN
jgi:hypothetical protein